MVGSIVRGALIGLTPLGLLVGVATLSLIFTVLARQLIAEAGFLVQQQTALITLIIGLILAIAVYAVAIWRILRQVSFWQQNGERAQASAMLWSLVITALVVAAPVLLALLFPQHPAP